MGYRSKYTGTQTEALLDRINAMVKLTYKGGWDAGSTPYAKGSIVSLNNDFFVARKETSEPPVPLYKSSIDTFILTGNEAYAAYGDWKTNGNRTDWICMTDSGLDLYLL